MTFARCWMMLALPPLAVISGPTPISNIAYTASRRPGDSGLTAVVPGTSSFHGQCTKFDFWTRSVGGSAKNAARCEDGAFDRLIILIISSITPVSCTSSTHHTLTRISRYLPRTPRHKTSKFIHFRRRNLRTSRALVFKRIK